MFVDITDFKGAIEVENMLRPYKRGAEKITPEVCFEVLEATNYKRNIRDMLECVAKLPVAEQAGFKDVVLSTFDNREQPNDVLVLGKKLAVAGGYEDELNEAAKIKDGDYLKSEIHAEKWCVTEQENWLKADLAAYEKMKFIGKKADLFCAKHLPENLDMSECEYVDMSNCDLSEIKNLKFKDGAEVLLPGAQNIPADLDVSMCKIVSLTDCDLADVKELKFGDGASACLVAVVSLPKNLDVSKCSEVDLSLSDLAGVEELNFREGAVVDLQNAANLPEKLDVSMCGVVALLETDVSGVKMLRFEDEEQMADSNVRLPADWEGRLAFADEENVGMDLGTIEMAAANFKRNSR